MRALLYSGSLLLLGMGLHAAQTVVPIDLMVQLLPDNPVIVEAGAQYGEDTDWMSLLWPKGTLYAFEPSPFSYPSLAGLAANRRNIVPFQLALSDQSGEMPFYLSGGASTLLEPDEGFNRDYFHVDVDKPLMVQVIRLDEWQS